MVRTWFRKEDRDGFVLFLLLSVAAHLILVLAFQVADRIARLNRPETHEVVVELVPATEVQKQIVQTKLTEKSKEASKKAYLGAQNQNVEREVVARKVATFRNSVMAGGSTKAGPAMANPRPTFRDLGVAMDLRPMGGLGPPGSPQEAASNDYLKKPKQGAETLLATREFEYYSFYQRVRQQLEQFWEPGLRDRLARFFRRGRSLASEHEHATKLLVVLDGEGVIRKVLVQDTSGVFDLDQAAVDAFNKAGPFPNPPHGMVEKDGMVRVEWEFVVRT